MCSSQNSALSKPFVLASITQQQYMRSRRLGHHFGQQRQCYSELPITRILIFTRQSGFSKIGSHDVCVLNINGTCTRCLVYLPILCNVISEVSSGLLVMHVCVLYVGYLQNQARHLCVQSQMCCTNVLYIFCYKKQGSVCVYQRSECCVYL